MKILLKKPYVFWLIVVFILYLILNIIFSGFYNTIQGIFIYYKTVDWVKLSMSIFLTILIGVLVSINAVYAYLLYKQRKRCLEGSAVAGVGTAVGLAAGVCPLCITGVFPLLLSLLGISFSFASLPLGGIEVQAGVVIILSLSLWMLGRK